MVSTRRISPLLGFAVLYYFLSLWCARSLPTAAAAFAVPPEYSNCNSTHQVNGVCDYYAVLGVPETADRKDIRSAYRDLAFAYHPDKSSHPDAESIFQQVASAYEILEDEEKRKAYDDFRTVDVTAYSYQVYTPPKSYKNANFFPILFGILIISTIIQYVTRWQSYRRIIRRCMMTTAYKTRRNLKNAGGVVSKKEKKLKKRKNANDGDDDDDIDEEELKEAMKEIQVVGCHPHDNLHKLIPVLIVTLPLQIAYSYLRWGCCSILLAWFRRNQSPTAGKLFERFVGIHPSAIPIPKS